MCFLHTISVFSKRHRNSFKTFGESIRLCLYRARSLCSSPFFAPIRFTRPPSARPTLLSAAPLRSGLLCFRAPALQCFIPRRSHCFDTLNVAVAFISPYLFGPPFRFPISIRIIFIRFKPSHTPPRLPIAGSLRFTSLCFSAFVLILLLSCCPWLLSGTLISLPNFFGGQYMWFGGKLRLKKK